MIRFKLQNRKGNLAGGFNSHGQMHMITCEKSLFQNVLDRTVEKRTDLQQEPFKWQKADQTVQT